MVNISGLNDYLEAILPRNEDGSVKAVTYGDAIYKDRETIVGRADKKQCRADPKRGKIDKRMSKIRIKHEHFFAEFENKYELFNIKKRHHLLNKGIESRRALIVAYFLQNVLSCFYGNSAANRFNCKKLELENYIPLDRDFSEQPAGLVVNEAEFWDEGEPDLDE
jgi:hypothetical protein